MKCERCGESMPDEGIDVEALSVGKITVCDSCYRTYLSVMGMWVRDGMKKPEDYEEL